MPNRPGSDVGCITIPLLRGNLIFEASSVLQHDADYSRVLGRAHSDQPRM